MNIDGFFNSFFVIVLQGARTVYSTLDSITFRDTSLLRYSITLLLLSVVVPMVITLIHTQTNNAFYGYEYGRDLKKREKVQERHAKKALKKKQKEAQKRRNEKGVL